MISMFLVALAACEFLHAVREPLMIFLGSL